MNEPTTPRTMVATMPIGSRPGTTRRATAPAMRPRTIQAMMVQSTGSSRCAEHFRRSPSRYRELYPTECATQTNEFIDAAIGVVRAVARDVRAPDGHPLESRYHFRWSSVGGRDRATASGRAPWAGSVLAAQNTEFVAGRIRQHHP